MAKQDKIKLVSLGWQEIADFLGLPLATAALGKNQECPSIVADDTYALPDELNRWLGKESHALANICGRAKKPLRDSRNSV